MDTFIKAAAAALVTLILYLTIAKQAKELSALLGLIACVMIAAAAFNYFEPIVAFWNRLQNLGKLDTEYIEILLRCVGIGVLSEIVSSICSDAGNAALGKTLQIMSGVVIIWLSLPLFTKLIELIEEMLLLI